MSIILPVDRLAELWPDRFRDRDLSVGALLHAASVNASLTPTLSILEKMQADGLLTLGALYGPQHGFDSVTQDNMVEWETFRHPRLDVPVYSLYGEHREPPTEWIADLDVVFIDLVDVGARYYTFIYTLLYVMTVCAAAGVPVVVADRPNPINGVTVEGTPQREDHLSFVGLHPLPNRHGMTIGELAEKFRADRFPNCDLTVLPMTGWDRAQYLDETDLPWVLPSPNMPTVATATVYPGMCLLEGTNVSEGRGTTRPFELFGAPWIDSRELVSRLEVPGAVLREASFQPGFQKFAGETCRGAQIHVTSRGDFNAYQTGIDIIQTLIDLYPKQFDWNRKPYEYEYEKLAIEILCGGPVDDFFDRPRGALCAS